MILAGFFDLIPDRFPMKTHRAFVHADSPDAELELDTDSWVDSRLTALLMGTGMSPLIATAAVLPLVAWLMWGAVNELGLLLWFVTTASFLAFRFYMFWDYRTHYADDVHARVVFLQRYGWSWGVAGLLWGAPAGLVMLSGDVDTLFVVGLVVIGHAVLSLITFSVQLRVFQWYANCLIAVVVVSFVSSLIWGQQLLIAPATMLVLATLLMVFWWLLMSAGQRMHEVHRANFELQRSNERLIASLQQQKRAALQAVATKNRFLASTAQDLRQPVHALGLYAGWLSSEPQMAADIAPKIVDATRAVNQLFDSLFDLTRIDAGEYKLQWQSVDLATLMGDVHLQFSDAAQSKGLSLRVRRSHGQIWSDGLILSRILGNFVSNAIRHTERGGVLVALRRRHTAWVFEVWDTGVGIAPEHQEPIFEEFYRVNLHQGTEDSLGLGLTVVSRLSAMMGYSLSLSSLPGRGSVFRLHVPMTNP